MEQEVSHPDSPFNIFKNRPSTVNKLRPNPKEIPDMMDTVSQQQPDAEKNAMEPPSAIDYPNGETLNVNVDMDQEGAAVTVKAAAKTSHSSSLSIGAASISMNMVGIQTDVTDASRHYTIQSTDSCLSESDSQVEIQFATIEYAEADDRDHGDGGENDDNDEKDSQSTKSQQMQKDCDKESEAEDGEDVDGHANDSNERERSFDNNIDNDISMDTDLDTEFDIGTSVTAGTGNESASTVPINNTHNHRDCNVDKVDHEHRHVSADNAVDISTKSHNDADNSIHGDDNDDNSNKEWVHFPSMPQDPQHPDLDGGGDRYGDNDDNKAPRRDSAPKSPPPIVSPSSYDLEAAKELTLTVTNTEEEDDMKHDIKKLQTSQRNEETEQDEFDTGTTASPSSTSITSTSLMTSNHSHQREIDNLKGYYESKLSMQRKEQEAQIDEILEQLNSIELSYADKLTKKDIMAEALTNSLSSYQIKNEEIRQQHEFALTRLDEAKHDIEAGEERFRSLTKQMELEKQQAIRQAQDEIRLAAESQFAFAQKKFLKLQHDYQKSCQEKDALRQEKEDMAKKVEALEAKDRENDDEMSKLMSEVAYAKAAMATVQAEMLKMKQSYNAKIQGYVAREKDAAAKIQQAENDCEEARVLVEQVVEEKEAAKQENLELQTLCEELMGIVEGNAAAANSINWCPLSRRTRAVLLYQEAKLISDGNLNYIEVKD